MTIINKMQAAAAARKVHAAEKAVKEVRPLKEALGVYAQERGELNKSGKSMVISCGEFLVESREKSNSVSYAKVIAELKDAHSELATEIDALIKKHTSKPEGFTVTVK